MRIEHRSRGRTSRGRSLPLGAVLTVVALVLAACGGGSGAGGAAAAVDQEAATDTAASAGVAGAEPVTVEVKVDEFNIEPSLSTFEAGVPYRFVVTNAGQIAHELMIGAPIEAGGMDMEEMDDLALAMIEEDDLGPGMTAEMTVTFPVPATADEVLEASCHLPGHYEAGMLRQLAVK